LFWQRLWRVIRPQFWLAVGRWQRSIPWWRGRVNCLVYKKTSMRIRLISIGWYLKECKSFIKSSNDLTFT
jgi:hypothetical protein